MTKPAADDSVKWCRKCHRPDRDLALETMRRAVPGSVGYYKAMTSWAPEPCDCREPEWEVDDP